MTNGPPSGPETRQQVALALKPCEIGRPAHFFPHWAQARPDADEGRRHSVGNRALSPSPEQDAWGRGLWFPVQFRPG